ncbi:hypothetical protein NEPAR05_0793 [Nematocida parisii]|nr:hypothetical protein NEPAR07_1698 [Nematocida parisii]KAI5156760.1 hypothetical protein NEPAR05_0793 [Nematocida parisii]
MVLCISFMGTVLAGDHKKGKKNSSLSNRKAHRKNLVNDIKRKKDRKYKLEKFELYGMESDLSNDVSSDGYKADSGIIIKSLNKASKILGVSAEVVETPILTCTSCASSITETKSTASKEEEEEKKSTTEEESVNGSTVESTDTDSFSYVSDFNAQIEDLEYKLESMLTDDINTAEIANTFELNVKLEEIKNSIGKHTMTESELSLIHKVTEELEKDNIPADKVLSKMVQTVLFESKSEDGKTEATKINIGSYIYLKTVDANPGVLQKTVTKVFVISE